MTGAVEIAVWWTGGFRNKKTAILIGIAGRRTKVNAKPGTGTLLGTNARARAAGARAGRWIDGLV
jgi:hypothetical protein